MGHTMELHLRQSDTSFKGVNDCEMNKHLIESFYTRTCIEGLPKAANLVASLSTKSVTGIHGPLCEKKSG